MIGITLADCDLLTQSWSGLVGVGCEVLFDIVFCRFDRSSKLQVARRPFFLYFFSDYPKFCIQSPI